MNKLLYKSGAYLKRYSPTILTCIGAIGVVATAVMAAKATPKAMKLCKKLKMERDIDSTSQALYNKDCREEPSKFDYVMVAWKCYIPAALIGVSTIFCIFGANALNKRKQASLASAYALLNQSYQNYRKAANSVYGEDADSKIKAQAAKEIYVSADGGYIYHPDLDNTGEKILFYDTYSERYFTSTMASVLNAEYHLNRNLNLRGETSVNEFYTFLGIDEIDCGHEIGWSMDKMTEYGFTWLDFQNDFVTLDDGLECYIVYALFAPDEILTLGWYTYNAETIIGNMDARLFLGGSEKTTLKDLSESLGKETIYLLNHSQSKGNSPSFSQNEQKLGKELMSIDELSVMDGSKCILQLRGVRPFLSDKYDITKHKNYRYLSDADPKNAFDIGKFVSTRLKVKPDEQYEFFEYTPPDEEMPNEAFDDFPDYEEDLEPI